MKKPKRLKVHALAALVPSMSSEAFAQLKDDIAKTGSVREPIWLKDGLIIDGRHRYKAACELDLGFETRDYAGDDIEDFVISMNLARRHLTSQQKTWFIKRLLKANPEKSDRQIADKVGVSPHTVASKRRQMESTVQIAQSTKTVGKDGRTYERQPSPPVTHPARVLATHIDLEMRRALRFLHDLSIGDMTDPDLMLRQLREQLERLEKDLQNHTGASNGTAISHQ